MERIGPCPVETSDFCYGSLVLNTYSSTCIDVHVHF